MSKYSDRSSRQVRRKSVYHRCHLQVRDTVEISKKAIAVVGRSWNAVRGNGRNTFLRAKKKRKKGSAPEKSAYTALSLPKANIGGKQSALSDKRDSCLADHQTVIISPAAAKIKDPTY